MKKVGRRCCVIGGTGFIGSYVTRLLVAAGRDVVVLGRRRQNEVAVAEGATYMCGDYGEGNVLRNALKDATEVIDLAYSTVPQTSFSDPVFDIISNLPPSVGLLQEAVASGVRKIVLVSSGGTVYGPARSLPISEDHPTQPISPYGITKLTIEKYGWMFNRIFDLPVVVVRPSNAYGEGQRPLAGQGFISTAVHLIAHGGEVEIYGSGDTVRDYIHVSDLASAVLAALDYGSAGQAYNVGTGLGCTNLEVLRAIEPLALRAGFTVRTKHSLQRTYDVPANVLDSSKLRELSGWRPAVEFRDGIARLWDATIAGSNH